MKKTWLVVLVAIMFAGIFSFPTATKACSCVQPPSVEEEVSRSKAVFSGTVLNVREKTSLLGASTKTVLFEVEETWKGIDQSQVMIGTGNGGGDCGSEYQEGTAYLVYAREPSLFSGFHELETLICSRTSELAAAHEDLTVLGAGTLPTEEVDLTSQKRRQTIFIILFLSVTIGFILFKRKKTLKLYF